jgi:hypothetical protein
VPAATFALQAKVRLLFSPLLSVVRVDLLMSAFLWVVRWLISSHFGPQVLLSEKRARLCREGLLLIACAIVVVPCTERE